MISYLYRQQRMAVTLATLSHCRCCYMLHCCCWTRDTILAYT